MEREEEDDNVVYGTRLVHEDELGRRKGKSAIQKGQVRQVAPWKQEVTDAEGRRRFHGAFTGGFSAGYFNTVGSKEGWTPSTFSSSRNQRAGKKEQTVYDFLDDDEKEELKLKELLPSGEYDAIGSTAAEVARRNASQDLNLWSSVVPGLVPDGLVSESQSRGVKLLMKMGWRHGFSVGEDRNTFPSVLNNRRGLGVVTLKSDHGNPVEINTVQEDTESDRSTFSRISIPQPFGKKEDCLPSFTAATDSSLPIQPLRLPSLVIPAGFLSVHVVPAPLDVEQYLSRKEPPEVPASDPKTTKAINGVAVLVARSGPKFEDILKQRHLKSPQFPFLFEGGAGREFYVRKVWEEQRNLSVQGKKQILCRSDNGRNDRAELLGANRGQILGEKLLPRTPIPVASSTNLKEESSSFERSEALSELSAQMNTRFTTGASDVQLNRVEGITHPSVLKQSSDAHSSDASDLPQITRRVETTWRPTALLCKRFNILDPYIGKETILPRPRIKPEPMTILANLSGTGKESSLNVSKPQPSTSAVDAWTNEDNRDSVTSEGATDLYKAIFSDDEDEDQDDNQRGSLTSNRKPALDPKDAAGKFLESLGKELGLRV